MNSKDNQGQQELPKYTIEAANAVKGLKHNTDVRKIVLQTLQPVMKGVQQQVNHLISESELLRSQRVLMEELQSTNREYKSEIKQLHHQISELSENLDQNEHKTQIKIQDFGKSITFLNEETARIEELANSQVSKVNSFDKTFRKCSELIQAARTSFDSQIQTLKFEVSNYYEDTLAKQTNVDQKMSNLSSDVDAFETRIQFYSKELTDAKKLSSLYEKERAEIQESLNQISELKLNSLSKREYERDKNYHRKQNQMMKDQIKQMLDEALSPEVRKFLPNLIKNIEILKKIEQQIQRLDELLNQTVMVELQEIKKTAQESSLESRNAQLAIKEQIRTEIEKVNRRFDELVSKQQKEDQQNFSRFQRIEEEIKSNRDAYLSDSDEKSRQIASLSNSVDLRLSSFIEENREELYKSIVQSRPVEQIEQQQRVRQKVEDLGLSLQAMGQEVEAKCNSVLNLGKSLTSHLETFQNQITKLKGDMRVQTNNVKKVLTQFENKLQSNEIRNQQQSSAFSRLIEIVMADISTNMSPQYLSPIPNEQGAASQRQVYISFHDGVICQFLCQENSSLSNQTQYRKRTVDQELLKRAILAQSAKLIDFITENFKDWKWELKDQKPSYFFQEKIYPAYVALADQKKEIIQYHEINGTFASQNKISSNTQKLKGERSRLISPQRSKQSMNSSKASKGSTSKIDHRNLKNLEKRNPKNPISQLSFQGAKSDIRSQKGNSTENYERFPSIEKRNLQNSSNALEEESIVDSKGGKRLSKQFLNQTLDFSDHRRRHPRSKAGNALTKTIQGHTGSKDTQIGRYTSFDSKN